MEQEIFLQILSKRGYKTKNQQNRFLNPDYDRDCHDPYLLSGMNQAVSRIQTALKKNEPIVIYGDYDVDGLCASSILYEGLRTLGAKNIEVYIPDRFKEGYGINKNALKNLAQKKCGLLITVDCGTNAFEEIDYANKIGIDVIITDHHSPNKPIPNAVAVINPKLGNSKYPFNDLAGCGVAFKLIQALFEKFKIPAGYEKWLLDLVAIGTICDIVELKGENRCLVYWGIEVLKKGMRPGLRELVKCAGLSPDDVNSKSIGFGIGPRLNAAGRIDSANLSFKLLTTKDLDEAKLLALKLDELNSKRSKLQSEVYSDALAQYKTRSADPLVFLHSPDWHQGVIGIVASKLMEHSKKPVFIFQTFDSDQIAKGSIRSYGDFSVAKAIKFVENLLISGGGHKHAGGCSLNVQNLDRTKKELEKFYCSLSLKQQSRYLDPEIDVKIKDFKGLSSEMLKLLQKLEPFGCGNSEPVFYIKNYRILNQKMIGSNNQHLKAVIADNNNNTHSAIGFNKNEDYFNNFELCFNFENNKFNGMNIPQLRLV